MTTDQAEEFQGPVALAPRGGLPKLSQEAVWFARRQYEGGMPLSEVCEEVANYFVRVSKKTIANAVSGKPPYDCDFYNQPPKE